MTFRSYAQNFEDVILWRVLKSIRNGFYIDVGANDPEIDSVTKLFYDMGWHGINIEPMPEPFSKLQFQRERDINLACIAASSPGEDLLYIFSGTGLSTTSKKISNEHNKNLNLEVVPTYVKADTLSNICDQYVTGEIHFLKVDVEGAEFEVLKGMNFKRYRPWILVIESTKPLSTIDDSKDFEVILECAGYTSVYFDGLNKFYLAAEHSDLKHNFISPPNVFDQFQLSGTSTSQFCNYIIQQHEKEMAILDNKLEISSQEVAELKKEHKILISHISAVEGRNDALQFELEVMNNSFSWKVTAFLRAFRRVLGL